MVVVAEQPGFGRVQQPDRERLLDLSGEVERGDATRLHSLDAQSLLERLGAYLAPRRFIEKRTVLGGPAAPAVREYLALEQNRLDVDRRWLEEKRRRIALAEENLEIRTREILDAVSS